MSPHFSATPAELTLVSQIFAKADPQNQGFIPTDVAVRISGGAKISPVIIGEVWNIADESKNGKVSRKDVAFAIRLMGWAQKGEKIARSLLNTPGPLAVIEGINAVGSQNTGISLPKSPPPAAFPPLTPQDRAKFQNLFFKAGAVNGILSGEKARDLFLRSKLSNEQLMLIWNLADTQDRGYLDTVDFAIGMYFIQGSMSGSISFIPTALPPGLYQQAAGLPPTTSVQSHKTGPSESFSPARSNFIPQTATQPVLQAQSTGVSPARVAPAVPARPTVPSHVNGHSSDWDVTPAEKASADQFFDALDTLKRGYIEGEAAVPFMLKSQLPGEVLAQIWDLADLSHNGRLTRDGFAVAMHLIQKKLAGQDVPDTLPPSLIPPSLRPLFLGQSPFSPVAAMQTQPQPEPVRNLLELDDDTPPPSAVQSQPPNILKPQTTGLLVTTARSPIRQTVDSDPFSVPVQSPAHDFFDNDIHTSPQLHDQSVEIGNLRNQLSSTEKFLSASKQERQTLEQTLADQASQLSTLQTQLSSAKAAYETEMSGLSALKDRRAAQITEIQKTREDLIRAESDLSAIRVEKSEIEGVFLRDKEEARDLHRRMVEASQQADALKAEVEKLKKEAKQQKGLLAIARKQLSTKEAEKAKADVEHQEAVAEVMSINEEKNAVEAEIASLNASPVPKSTGPFTSSDSLTVAASLPLPATPDVASVKSVSNNPFERLAMSSGSSTPRSQSPFLVLQNASPPVSINGAFPAPQPQAEAETKAEVAGEQKAFEKSPPSSHGFDLSAFEPDLVPEDPPSPSPNENFVTPPMSVNRTATSDSTSSAVLRFPSLDDMSSSASSAPKMSPPSSSAPKSPTHEETDLSSQLKELDNDSGSDSDEERDAGHRVADGGPVANGKAAAIVSSVTDGKDVNSAVNNLATPQPAPTTSNANLFDTIFKMDGATQAEVPAGNETATPFEALMASTDQANGSSAPKDADSTYVAGVDEFDKAMGMIPASTSTGPVDFFDDSFGENFDFDSANADFPIALIDPRAKAQPASFDNIFGTSDVTSPAAPPLVMTTSPIEETVAPTDQVKYDTKLDTILETVDSPPSAAENKPAKSPVPPAASAPDVQPHEEGSMPGAFPSQPVSPVVSRTSAEKEKEKEKEKPSPPARVASPKLRVPSSSKEVSEKSRHRLSIRLPFRKKKHQEPMPVPSSQLLSPPLEEPRRTRNDDEDVEAVKQLISMGFQREQAIAALEKYDYDVQRALNQLLGAR